MKRYHNILLAGLIWSAQAFCNATDASHFMSVELTPAQQKTMRVTTSYSPGCIGQEDKELSPQARAILQGQLTTVWYQEQE